MQDRKGVEISPIAAALHHGAGQHFWENRAKVLINEVVALDAQVKALEAELEQYRPSAPDPDPA